MAILYKNEIFIKANPYEHNYYYHTHDRWEREAYCDCGNLIGTQVKYSKRKKFYYKDIEKEDYKFCPYCGEKLHARTPKERGSKK